MAEHLDDDITLYAVPKGKRLHTLFCPHLNAQHFDVMQPANEDEIATIPVCADCQKVLNGARARMFDTFDEALEAFGAPVANRPLMRELAATLTYTRIAIPASNPYIALAPARGHNVVGYFSKSYVDVRTDAGYDRTWLPVSRESADRTGTRAPREAQTETCPNCYTKLPNTGECDGCGYSVS